MRRTKPEDKSESKNCDDSVAAEEEVWKERENVRKKNGKTLEEYTVATRPADRWTG